MRPNGTAGGKEYQVQDTQAFAALISAAILERYAGKRDHAAQALGIPHNTLRRYQLEQGNAIRHETLLKLRRLVGRENAPALEAALLSPAARELLGTYDTWVANEILWIVLRRRGILKSRTLKIETSAKSEASARLNRLNVIIGTGELSTETLRVETVQKLLSTLQRRFRSAWKPLNDVLENRHFHRRALLAQLRVIAPMFDYLDSGGIELEPGEWSVEEVSRFIKAGAIREAILLKRDTDIRRAQEGVSPGPSRTKRAKPVKRLSVN